MNFLKMIDYLAKGRDPYVRELYIQNIFITASVAMALLTILNITRVPLPDKI